MAELEAYIVLALCIPFIVVAAAVLIDAFSTFRR